ncbi:MAG: alpha/beta fold hydrolase [Sandaracinaceae bacterium]|nr:alpha/beta fold hydrolase [Sandaracinaceae bacterium]
MRRKGIRRWRGLKSLVHDAVDATTDLVDLGHESTSRAVTGVADHIEPLREPVRFVDGVRRVTTRGVLGTVKVVNRAVEAVTDVALDAAERAYPEAPDAEPPAPMPMRSDVAPSGAWVADAALGLVNAAVGDHLATKRNGLDLEMVFRAGDRYVALEPDAVRAALPEASPRVALFVHGLGTTEWSWCLEAEAYHGDPAASFGSLLQRDLGFTPIYLRYNTGRHVAQNGRQLADELQRFVEAYPVPIEELVLVGHSMGGLVVRSACHYGAESGHGWTARVTRVFCLGTPHRGAPLAKLGHALTGVLDAIDLPGTKIGARILAGRSAGIQDLRHGAVLDEDWLRTDPDARSDATLLAHARHYFVSATITDDPDHAVGRLIGDLLVRVPSAGGPALEESHFSIDIRRYGGVMHHQLQNHPAVYEQLRRACDPGSEALE